jgi:hypothetical protein
MAGKKTPVAASVSAFTSFPLFSSPLEEGEYFRINAHDQEHDNRVPGCPDQERAKTCPGQKLLVKRELQQGIYGKINDKGSNHAQDHGREPFCILVVDIFLLKMDRRYGAAQTSQRRKVVVRADIE